MHLGSRNDSGGYELRNERFKSCISPKDVTTINGSTNRSVVNLVEGFFDLLSILTLTQKTEPDNDTIVLNTTAFMSKVLGTISAYNEVNLFLDNDDAGLDASAMVKSKYVTAIDWSYIYRGHNDFNEFLSRKLAPDH